MTKKRPERNVLSIKLYICVTYYHVLITTIKSILSGEKPDLLLSNIIPGYEQLVPSLEKSGLFGKITALDNKRILPEQEKINKRLDQLMRQHSNKKIVDKYLDMDFGKYSDIYVYQDAHYIAYYLIAKKYKYHLIEDALDYFRYFDKYYGIAKTSYDPHSLKFRLKRLTGLGTQAWGNSKYCVDVEVNSLKDLKMCNEKYFEVPRKELFGRLTDDQKKTVYKIFAENKKVNSVGGDAVLVCTQPMFKDGHVSSMEVQLNVFEAVVREYSEKGYQIVIKPHPRDEADYSKIIEKYHCGYIDKNLPSEVLNYDPDARPYYAAISITSTSINFLDCATNKVFMGMDYAQSFDK